MEKAWICFIVLISADIYGQTIPYGKEFQVNACTENNQENHCAAALQQGGFAICWQSPSEGSSYAGIFGQAFAADGGKIGDEFQANTTAKYAQLNPQIIPLQGGGFLVIWESGEQEGYADGIRGRVFTRDGQKDGDEFRVSTYVGPNPGAYDAEIQSVVLVDGGIIICWQIDGQDGSGLGIYGRRIEPDGRMIGDEFRINTHTAGHQGTPKIASLANGGFVVCWTSYGQDGNGEGVFGQIFSADGSKAGEEFRINSSIEGYQWKHQIASLREDGFAVIWIATDGGESSSGIFVQCFSMDGQRTEDEFRLEQFFEVGMWGPLISPLQKGGFLVCWVIYDTSLAGVYGQLFSSTGKKTGGVFLVNTCTRLDQTDPQIELLGEDRLLACWMSQEQDGSGWGIYGQILTSDGQKTEKEFQINTHTEGDQFFPTVISLQDSGFAACWQSDGQDGSGTGVFAKRYPASPLVHALVPFDLMRPSDGNSIKNTNPTLSWHQASTRIVCYPWELDYRVYVDDNPSFLSPQVIEQDQDTTFVLQNLTPGTTYFWKVLAKNISGDSLWSSNTNAFFVAYDATSVVDIGQAKTPKEFTLHQNYPNPFNPETTIRFDLPATGFVQIAIYNISGKLVKVLMRESRTGGNYSVKWNGRDSAGNATPSGIYICRMEVRSADGRRFTRSVKMGLVR